MPTMSQKASLIFWCAVWTGLFFTKSVAGAPYSEWRLENFDSSAALESQLASADPDGDGLPNAIEWFYRTDPLSNDSVSYHGVRKTALGYVFEFSGNSALPVEVVTVQVSTDLLHWADSPEAIRLTGTQDGLHNYECDLGENLEENTFVRLSIVDLQAEEPSLAFSFDGQGSGDGTDPIQGELRGGAEFSGNFGSRGALELGESSYFAVPLEGGNLGLDGDLPDGKPYTICSWVRLGNNASLDGEEHRLTIAEKGLWTKPPFFSFGLRGGAFRGIYFQINDATLTGPAYPLAIPSSDVREAFEGEAIWRHVAFVRGSDGIGRLYLDGAEVGTQPKMDHRVEIPTSPILPRTEAISPLDELWIGRGYSRTGSQFDGQIADFRTYRDAIPPADLMQLVVDSRPEADWTPWRINTSEPDKIYVSPLGDDSNPGTEESPFATIAGAIDALHEPGEARRHIFVKHGIYREGIRRFATQPRRSGEAIIAVDGVTLEAEPRGDGPGEFVSMRGSLTKAMPGSSPLSGLFPNWEAVSDDIYRATQTGRTFNIQSVYFDGAPLLPVGESTLPSLGVYLPSAESLWRNQAANLNPGRFWTTEALELHVPSTGGAAIRDGYRFWIFRGGNKFLFEFNEVDNGRITADAIAIQFSDGRDVFGAPDGVADSQETIAAAIMAALGSQEAAAMGITPTLSADYKILLGERPIGDVDGLVLNSLNAPSLNSGKWEIFLRLPGGADPNDPQLDLEIPHCVHLLVIEGQDVTVRGFDFRHTNGSAFALCGGVEIRGNDALFEDNHVVDCDAVGVTFRSEFTGGLVYPRSGVVLLNNQINRCGNSGIASTFSRNCRFIGNETSANNWRNFNATWHAGGFKLNNYHEDLRVIQHTARGNRGSGIWFDTVDIRHPANRTDVIKPADFSVEVSESVLEFNSREGCFYEKSRNGTIVDNTIRYNRREGIRISKSSNCIVARNLIQGNRYEGIVKDPGLDFRTLRPFSVPVTHPLADNWSNTVVYSLMPFSANRFYNNIFRNNSLLDFADHNPDDIAPASLAGLFGLPTNLNGNSTPIISMPSDNGLASLRFGPINLNFIQSNQSDYNILWRAGRPFVYGNGSSIFIQTAQFESRLTGVDGLLDYKDLDIAFDGLANRAFSNRPILYANNSSSYYQPFPMSDEYSFDRMSQTFDSFEFIDSPEAEAAYGTLVAGADRLIDPDGDGDGIADFWESIHGLDATRTDGIHGAAGDPDGDGLTNLQEYLNWTRGSTPSGDRYDTLAEFRQATFPTYFTASSIGRPRDIDGDRLPDTWEVYYGLDPLDPSDAATVLPLFLRGIAPGPLVNDSDADLLPDDWELAHFSNLAETGEGDTDGDGFSNVLEFRLWTLPNAPDDPLDRDADGLPDTWEIPFGFSTTSASGNDGGAGDPDADGVSNRLELEQFTHPLRPEVPGN